MNYTITEDDYETMRTKAIESLGEIGVGQAMFEQTFGSTALGFGGIGGWAMCTVPVTVFWTNEKAVVFVSTRLAYAVVCREHLDRLGKNVVGQHVVEAAHYRGEYGPRFAPNGA